MSCKSSGVMFFGIPWNCSLLSINDYRIETAGIRKKIERLAHTRVGTVSEEGASTNQSACGGLRVAVLKQELARAPRV